jgi:hypothetical protein
LYDAVIANNDRVDDGLRQYGEVGGGLLLQGCIGILPGDEKRLLARQWKHQQQNKQNRAQNTSLRTEMHMLYKSNKPGRMRAHTYSIGADPGF